MERVTGMALWRQIETELAGEIQAGLLRPGDRLPTESELAARFQVNRHTVRRAVAALQESGVVRVEQGRGTFVQEDVVDYQVGKRTRFSENIVTLNRHPGGRLLRALEIPADGEAARNLGVRRGTRLILIEHLREVDERPISVSTHYFVKQRCDGLIEAYRECGSITQALFRVGIKDYLRDVTRVTARLPDADDARLLQQPRTQPVLVSEGVNVDLQQRPIEYALGRFSGQRVQFVFRP
ncbi:GntR family phosphonate transport system transcriptional regulator [Natronocella acetinitrilica]|uniref:GntR family phosphonate transport system transcriptional regulator n=1 Tax=Natronocella acetinitrilica TaxID=414046 RepID=A0AAE3KDL6_9GAMM|nr:phosphonate metabolism transcriptional regulator PhnF [Natronocella acetinitrilica]MCP1676458.1 GntR family phosphonate transport system transcriptional regulator [Natronocella acetinitrilica]